MYQSSFVWGVNCRNKNAHYFSLDTVNAEKPACSDVHDEDRPHLMRLLWRNVLDLLHHDQPSRNVVSIHRVKAADGRYWAHLSLIKLRRGKNNRLASISGIDYRLPDDIPLKTLDLQFIARKLRNTPERLGHLYTWMAGLLRRNHLCDDSLDARSEIWCSGNYFISPSEQQMVKVDGGPVIRLTPTQSELLTLLLATRDARGNTVIVKRREVRRIVYKADPDSRESDDRINHDVLFLRKHLGKHSITTIPKTGHRWEDASHICSGKQLTMALSCLRGTK